ncbi:RNA methyltransferase [Hyphobacterium sp. HN65]|uniref:RNA methyltransferase n=1 Tax=Hyphobacterium lacteum TaxID=3116575 RepID=A0ABU7LTF7_9PROT|nr:RNA methyltransferase [Hyphobacterium sp. HN65]MEE2527210.1 RNA methyltransferase [Hyphobacterium sp. HN65]
MTMDKGRNRQKPPYKTNRSKDSAVDGEGWIWGRHAVLAALANPRREKRRLLLTLNAQREVPEGTAFEDAKPDAISATLPEGAVHQGFALRATAPAPETVRAVADPTHGILVVLDQVTDPQNVGAVFRSAAAFGARAIILQDRKAPPLFGATAKASVGATETVRHVRVTNIADTLIELKKAGRFVIGLAGDGELALPEAIQKHGGAGLVIVMGAEDKGLRPRVAENCDALVSIPTTGAIESLNISNAAAIALYAAYAARPDRKV